MGPRVGQPVWPKLGPMARPSRNGKRGRKKGVTETQHMKCECKISTTHEIMEDGQLSAPN